MKNEFALDLRVARRESGLTQADTAHLLGVDRTRITALEKGDRTPSVRELCMLSIILGKTFESLFGGIFFDVRPELRERIRTMPEPSSRWAGTFNRHHTLERLADRLLEAYDTNDHG